MSSRRLQIAVIGSAGNEEYEYERPSQALFEAAKQAGFLLAKKGCIVVNGGKGGVMEAVCEGARSAGGLTVAEVSGSGRGQSNKYVDVEIVTTDIGFRGPSQLIGMSDAVLAFGGGAGTLQEIAVAYRMKKPIILLVGYGGWADRLKGRYLDERRLVRFERTTDLKQAVERVVALGKVELDKYEK